MAAKAPRLDAEDRAAIGAVVRAIIAAVVLIPLIGVAIALAAFGLGALAGLVYRGFLFACGC
jgi:hypothetical protein